MDFEVIAWRRALLFASLLCGRALPFSQSSRRQPGELDPLQYLQLGVAAEPTATAYGDEELSRVQKRVVD